MSHHTNIVRIKAVARALGELNNKVVFVGGATLSFYSTRQGFEVRPTEDVDIIIEILNYANQADLDDTLRSIGFTNDIESGVMCRWRIEKIIVDIMATEATARGVSNKWYPAGYRNAIWHGIDDQCDIRILPAPYFLATKFEAFKDRGQNDGRTSHDFEDVVYVLENRKEIWDELKASNMEVRNYLINEFSQLLLYPNIVEWIDCHVERNSPPATDDILRKLKECVRQNRSGNS